MSTTKEASIAIIGLGNIGLTLAQNFVKGNRKVILADRTLSKAQKIAAELGSIARPSDILSAIKEADIIIPAIWFSSIQEFFKEYSHELEGKIIIDPSNPIAPDDKGGFVKIIEETASAGETLLSRLPKGAKLVKALGTLGAGSLASIAGHTPDPAVLFYATNEDELKPTIEELIVDAGFDPLYIGGIDQSIRLEVFGDLHEFGALGKTVTLAEAKVKL